DAMLRAMGRLARPLCFFQAGDGIRARNVTGVQTCALPICRFEEARAYASLVDEFELGLGEVAERVGRSKSSVSNRLRLLELPEEIGRASCRERGWGAGRPGAGKQKNGNARRARRLVAPSTQ